VRLPVQKIKQGIFRPEEEVRVTAVAYFTESFSPDATIMPLVIEAVEKYGRNSSFSILRKAEYLVQTASTLDWLIRELRRNFDIKNIADDNLRFALALVIVAAPVELLEKRKTEINGLENFPESLRGSLDERVQMKTWGLEQCWEALEELGRKTMKRGECTSNESRHASRIIESLAQYPDERGDMVLALLRKNYPGKDDRLMIWLESDIIELAGEMRLEAAIPVLVEHLHSDDLALADAATMALSRIGTDKVVESIADDWWDGNDDFRGSAADVLDKIHSDLCAERCLEFLDGEEDMHTALALGHALLSNFAFDGIEPVRELILENEDDLSPDHFDLRYHLVAAATIMRTTFPEYEEWYKDALKTNWGWGDHEYARLADSFRSDPIGPKQSGNGHG
jgi:hypothetical protein